MRKIERGNSFLILRDSPYIIRIFGSLFILAGLVGLYLVGGGASNYQTLKRWEVVASTVVVFGVFIGGLWFTFSHPTITTRIDRIFRIVEIKHKSLFKNEIKTIPFAQIEGFIMEKRFDSDNDAYYDIALQTLDSQTISVTTSWARGDVSELLQLNTELNDFIK